MRIFKVIGVVIVLIGVAFGFYLFRSTHDEFIYLVEDISNLDGKEEKLKSIITQQKFNLIKIIPFLISVMGVIVFLLSKNIEQSTRYIIRLLSNIIAEIKLIHKKYLTFASIIILLSFCIKLYYLLKIPISYDEAWTYLNFTSKGFFSSLSYYPAPNNHILHSLLTNLFSYLPFDQTINLRLPNLIMNTLSIAVLFLAFTKLLSERIAISCIIIYSFLFPIMYYGYCSRGYSLLLLSFIICFYASVQIIVNHRKKSINKYILYLSFGSVVGFYTIPSFLYPYAAIMSFLFLFLLINKSKEKILPLIISGLVTTFVVVLLYTPVFIISGIKSITSNNFVNPTSQTEVLEKLYSHFSDTSISMFHLNVIVLIGLLFLMAIVLLMRKHKRDMMLFGVYIIAVSPIILIVHSVIPFARTWIYLIIPVLFLIGLFVESLWYSNKHLLFVSMMSIIISIFLFIDFNKRIYQNEYFSFAAKNLSDYLIKNQAQHVYCNHPLIETNLIYLFGENKFPAQIKYSRFTPIQEDKFILSKECDYLVIEKEIEQISGYEQVKNYDGNLFVYKKYLPKPRPNNKL